jgi:hypothetical protein
MALASTVNILSQIFPGVLIHCIQQGVKLSPLVSVSSSGFPTSGMMAQNYMYIRNPWLIQHGTRNKLKLPAAKVERKAINCTIRNTDMMDLTVLTQYYR